MFPAIRVRFDAFVLSRKLSKSLLADKGRWKTDADADGNPVLSNADFRIVLVPRTPRVLDAVHLYKDETEIWLPLASRLRLRAAARLRLIRDASESAPKSAAASRATRTRLKKRRARAV